MRSDEGKAERLDNPFRQVEARQEDLPAGLRAMTGYEEELVERHRDDANGARLCNLLVAHCLVPPGAAAGAEAALEKVRGWSVAERDRALIFLRQLTFGDEVRTTVRCEACEKPMDVSFRLGDLPLALKEAPSGVTVSLGEIEPELAGVGVVLRLPTAGDQEALLDAGLEGEAERRTWLLSRLIVRWGGRAGPFDAKFARGLSVRIRAKLEEAVEAALPELDLSMSLECPECGHAFTAPFDAAGFFLPS